MTKRKILAGMFSCVALLGWCWIPAFAGMTEGIGMTDGGVSPIVIGEVAWAGSSLSTADEWLELWNTSSTDISIGGWTLRGASAEPIIFPTTATIPALGVFLVSNYPESEAKSVLATTSHLVTTAIALSNSQLRIELLDASGALVDMAGDGGVPPAGASGSFKTSMIRALNADGSNAWVSATTSMFLKQGMPDLATPGWYDGFMVRTQEPAAPVVEMVEAAAAETVTGTDMGADLSEVAVEPQAKTPPEETPPAAHAPDPPPRPNYHLLRLNEIAPAPAKGKEWLEIISLDLEKPTPLTGCELHDAQGRILLLKSGKILPGQHHVIRFSRAVLANAGDSVSLHAPDGGLIDTFRYGKTAKGSAWTRYPDAMGDWQLTASSTPGHANAIPAPNLAGTTSSTEKMTDMATSTTEDLSDEEAAPLLEEEDAEEDMPGPSAEPGAKSKPIKKPKTAKVAAASLIHPMTLDMLSSFEADGPVRVRLHGRVGTPPALIKARSFVLQAPDGRGLLVTATTDRKLPAMGQAVTLTGRLTAGEDGALLKLHADDAWSLDRSDRTPSSTPRNVDLFAPSGQDIWSLVQASGTVQDVKGRKVMLDADGVTVEVNIATRVAYRPQRLKKGDIIQVSGILAPAIEAIRIYPRSAEDIEILRHAPSTQTGGANITDKQERSPIGKWTPVGATMGAIGAAEGAKRLHRKRKQKLLEKKAIPQANQKPT